MGIVERVTQTHSKASYTKEEHVKKVVRRILDWHDVYNFMPPSNAFGKAGISDILAFSNGRFAAIECKFGSNKPTAMQLEFGDSMDRAGGLFVVVNEKNLAREMIRVVTFLETGVDPNEPE